MLPEPQFASPDANRSSGSVPPPLPASQLSPIGAPPPVIAGPLPPPPITTSDASFLRRTLAILLSMGLGLFLADGFVSLADDSLVLFFDSHVLTLLRSVMGLPDLLFLILIYFLMGLTPMIPKRQFLPLTLFIPVATLALVPFAIYCSARLHLFVWGSSVCQVSLGLGVLWWMQSGLKFRWPLVAEPQLQGRRFRWGNSIGFVLVNVFALLPAVLIYLVVCAALAVNHFSDGFVALRPAGMTVQVRTYVRNDGKTVRLVPMSHVGEPEFYRTLSESFPTNSLILMEGVTDDQGLLTNKLTYQRMAKALGVTEQHEAFQPRGELVSADVDIGIFSKSTLGFLNLVMRLHSNGVDLQTVLQLMQTSTARNEAQLLEDLLGKRNEHLLGEIRSRLTAADYLIVPWGAAHMPEVARGIQKLGFHLEESQEYVAIRFRSAANKQNSDGKEGNSGKLK